MKYCTPISYGSYTAEDNPDASTRSSGGLEWYYNTGTNLPKKADYSHNSLLTTLHAGNIVVERNTVASGITGHAAIVEGQFWSSTYSMYYIRVIEAISVGVCRSVMDDERVEVKDAYFYTLADPDFDASVNSVMWAVKQLGKPYYLHTSGTSTSASHPNWYCSELVYAAYYNQGVNTLSNHNTNAFVYPY